MDFTVKFEQQELQTVFNALAALPYGTVAPLIAKIGQQVQAQQQPQQHSEAPQTTTSDAA